MDSYQIQVIPAAISTQRARPRITPRAHPSPDSLLLRMAQKRSCGLSRESHRSVTLPQLHLETKGQATRRDAHPENGVKIGVTRSVVSAGRLTRVRE